MAFINGVWHDHKARGNKIETLRKYIASRVRTYKTMAPEDKLDLKRIIDEFRRLRDIHRGETDLLFFNYKYFGDNLNPDNAGNWIPAFDAIDINLADAPEDILKYAPEFHNDICDIMNVVSNEEMNKRVVVAAPRSHAKSSFLSKGFPIHEIVYRKRQYIILISETPSVSSANLDWLKIQLTGNEALIRDFGRILSAKQQMNPKDNQSEFIAWEDLGDGKQKMLTLVQAASSGQALRGRNWNGTRPDLIVCDDVDSEKNNNTAELREELKSWFRQVVVPLGDPEGKKTAIVFMGTTIHHQSLLIDVMNHRADFESRRYQAIIKMPTREDLWEECRKIYVNRDDPRSAKTAELFYIANKEEMDAGSEVLWPSVQPIFKLMAWKWDNGSKAFQTEYMNNPLDVESMVFNPETFTYWDERDPGRQFLHDSYNIYLSVDFALGKEKGDYSAISVIAKEKATGVAFVVDSFIERIKPEDFMRKIVEMTTRWQPDGVAAEAVAAQEFFVDQLKQALAESGYPAHRRVKKIYSRGRKALRIEAMAPDIENGKIQFSRKHSMLLEQFERYGADHDDGPDSLSMALDIAKNGKREVINKPSWL